MPRTHGPAHPFHLDVVPDGGYVTRVLGVPVALRGSVLVLFALLGWAADGAPTRAPYWALFGTVTLLAVHVAQAVAARAAGLGPTVELSWIGGLTRWHTREHPNRLTALLALAAAPAAALTIAGFAHAATLVVASSGRVDVLTAVTRDSLDVVLLVAFGIAVVELLPARSRSAGRALHALLPGMPLRRTIRVATISTLACGPLVVALLLGPNPWLAFLPGFYVVTDGWVAFRGERTIGRRIVDAVAHDDWRTVRRRVLAGCDSPQTVAEAQEAFLARSMFEGAAEVGDAALRRWDLPGFAVRTARARIFMEQPDLALNRVRDAVRLGADPDELAEVRMFRSLTTSPRWPSSRDDVAVPPTHDPTAGAMAFSSLAS